MRFYSCVTTVETKQIKQTDKKGYLLGQKDVTKEGEEGIRFPIYGWWGKKGEEFGLCVFLF